MKLAALIAAVSSDTAAGVSTIGLAVKGHGIVYMTTFNHN